MFICSRIKKIEGRGDSGRKCLLSAKLKSEHPWYTAQANDIDMKTYKVVTRWNTKKQTRKIKRIPMDTNYTLTNKWICRCRTWASLCKTDVENLGRVRRGRRCALSWDMMLRSPGLSLDVVTLSGWPDCWQARLVALVGSNRHPCQESDCRIWRWRKWASFHEIAWDLGVVRLGRCSPLTWYSV
jgi:hypothetical protein